MHEYVIFNNFDSHPKQQYMLSDLPLHLTFLDNFYSQLTPEEIMVKLAPLANMFELFNTIGLSREMFGPQYDVWVTRVEKSDELQDIHMKIIEVLDDDIEFKLPQFTKENYSPHVTDQPSGSVAVDEKLAISNLTLVEIIGDKIVVHATYDLA